MWGYIWKCGFLAELRRHILSRAWICAQTFKSNWTSHSCWTSLAERDISIPHMIENILLFTTFMLGVYFYKCRERRPTYHVIMKDMVLVGESFENNLTHCHRMPYDVEIENDVNVIAIWFSIYIYISTLYIVTLSEFYCFHIALNYMSQPCLNRMLANSCIFSDC